jgi:hypothetical protein
MMSSSASMVRALSFKQLSKGGKLLKSQKPQKFVSPTTATIPKKKRPELMNLSFPNFARILMAGKSMRSPRMTSSHF